MKCSVMYLNMCIYLALWFFFYSKYSVCSSVFCVYVAGCHEDKSHSWCTIKRVLKHLLKRVLFFSDCILKTSCRLANLDFTQNLHPMIVHGVLAGKRCQKCVFSIMSGQFICINHIKTLNTANTYENLNCTLFQLCCHLAAAVITSPIAPCVCSQLTNKWFTQCCQHEHVSSLSKSSPLLAFWPTVAAILRAQLATVAGIHFCSQSQLTPRVIF